MTLVGQVDFFRKNSRDQTRPRQALSVGELQKVSRFFSQNFDDMLGLGTFERIALVVGSEGMGVKQIHLKILGEDQIRHLVIQIGFVCI